ncbi:MAG: hypothetical protein LBJ00_17475 [Planctomycetaceae bacterium]|nr:hypothetical protein [Planctomycetaceae bacterium]
MKLEKRSILKRNPVRADEINKNRQSKILKLNKVISERNLYLEEHSRKIIGGGELLQQQVTMDESIKLEPIGNG